MINIDYKNKTVKEYIMNPRLIKRDFDVQLAKKVSQRIEELQSFNNVYQLLNSGIDNPHLLIGDLNGCIGWDLSGRIRLIIKICDQFVETTMADAKDIRDVIIEGVRDYHDGNKRWLIN